MHSAPKNVGDSMPWLARPSCPAPREAPSPFGAIGQRSEIHVARSYEHSARANSSLCGNRCKGGALREPSGYADAYGLNICTGFPERQAAFTPSPKVSPETSWIIESKGPFCLTLDRKSTLQIAVRRDNAKIQHKVPAPPHVAEHAGIWALAQFGRSLFVHFCLS